MNSGSQYQERAGFLAGGGEMRAQMRAKNWAATSLGALDGWSPSLRTVLRIMLDSRYAMWMAWGPELLFFYNDAYARDTLGKKHPWALGRPAPEVWAEIWSDIGPRIDRVLSSGQATWDSDLLLFLERNGYPEETYHTFSYSPLYDEQEHVAGMLCVVTEETERVIAERRVALLRDLAAASTRIKTQQDVFDAVERCLRADSRDLPFTLTYLFGSQDETARLVAFTGLDASLADAANAAAALWPWRDMRDAVSPVVLDELPSCLQGLQGGPGLKCANRAMLVPLAQQGQSRPAGYIVAGLNPHRPLDEGYRGFISLLVGQIAAALANAHAYEQERLRAEALVELDRAKTAFFSNVSHEFRTPLTLMLGPLEDTISNMNGVLPAQAAKELTIVHRNGLRLLKLVNSLLDFSRIEAGRAQATYEPTDLALHTVQLASVFRSAVEKAGMQLIVDCPALPVPVYVDREMWEKIVLNLLSNAFKFTLKGEIQIRLGIVDDAVELSVSDTGCGIPDHELPHLFERFHRVEGTKGRTHEGTGIGLALVQELVKLHGGTVHAESRLDQGSTFRVRIPRGSAHLPAERISRASNHGPTALRTGAFVEEAKRWVPELDSADAGVYGAEALPVFRGIHHSPQRIVLADDNADMREYVRRLLAGRGFLVESVANGEAALAAIKRQRPDLVLTDVMMPKLDGFGLLHAIRSDASLAEIPVVMLSARAGEEATVEGIEAGADDYLVKPFSANELLAKIEGRLALAGARREVIQRIAQFETLLNEAPLGVYLVDADFRIRQVNPTAFPIFRNIPGLIGRRFDEVTHLLWLEDYANEIVRLFRHTLETGEPCIVPERIEHRRDLGVTEYYEWQINRIPLPEGRFGVVCYFRDISRQVLARQALREQAQLLDIAHDAIIARELDGRIALWNLGAEEMYGYAGHEAVGRNSHDLLRTEFSESRVGIEEHLVRKGRWEGELTHTTRSGARIVVASRWVLRPGSNGRPDGVMEINTDITEHKRAEERERRAAAEALATAQANAKFRTFFDQGTYFAGIMTIDGTLVEANRLCLEACGFTREEVIGKKFWECGWWNRSAELVQMVRAGSEEAAAGRLFRRESVYFVADGSERVVDLVIAPVKDESGRVLFIAPSGTDITDRIQLADERERLLDAERSARAEAERASRLKEDFLATLSHELRTPLNAILGWTQILEQGINDPDTLAEGLAVIARNARAQTQLIEDLLDMSRITSGKLRLEVQRVDLSEAIAASIESVRPAAEAKEIRLTKVLDSVRTVVSGDPHRLQQIIWNLLSNAIKFTPKSGRVQVILKRVDSLVELSVVDSGPGISPAFLPHVFERFRQADASTKRSFGGLGLGLAIVKQLVELHGGTVRALSAGEGQGATFTVALPIIAVQVETEDRSSPIADSDCLSSLSLDGVKVLVVDDEPDVRDLVKRILDGCRATVITASSVAEAISCFKSERPHVIVSDIGMPDQDGYEFMRMVRSLRREEGGQTPAAALTAYARVQDRRQALMAGYQSHVVKPADPAELITVVASLAGRLGQPGGEPR